MIKTLLKILKDNNDKPLYTDDYIWIDPRLKGSLSYAKYNSYVKHRLKAFVTYNKHLSLSDDLQIIGFRVFIREANLPPKVFLSIFRSVERPMGKLSSLEMYLSFLIGTGKYYELVQKT